MDQETTTLYNNKLMELKKFIPFLDNMEERLKLASGGKINVQLAKIQGLKNLIKGDKRMKMENLTKCEQVLTKLYKKTTEKLAANQSATGPAVEETSQDTCGSVNSPAAEVVREEPEIQLKNDVNQKLSLNFYKEQSDIETECTNDKNKDGYNSSNVCEPMASNQNSISPSSPIEPAVACLPFPEMTVASPSPENAVASPCPEIPIIPTSPVRNDDVAPDVTKSPIRNEGILIIPTSPVRTEDNIPPVSKRAEYVQSIDDASSKENTDLKFLDKPISFYTGNPILSSGKHIPTITNRPINKITHQNKPLVASTNNTMSDVDMRTPFSDVDLRFSSVFIPKSSTANLNNIKTVPPDESSKIPVLLGRSNTTSATSVDNSHALPLSTNYQPLPDHFPLQKSDCDMRVIDTSCTTSNVLPKDVTSITDFNILSLSDVRGSDTPASAPTVYEKRSEGANVDIQAFEINSSSVSAVTKSPQVQMKSCVVKCSDADKYEKFISNNLHALKQASRSSQSSSQRKYTRVLVSPVRNSSADYKPKSSRSRYSRSPSPRRRRSRSRDRYRYRNDSHHKYSSRYSRDSKESFKQSRRVRAKSRSNSDSRSGSRDESSHKIQSRESQSKTKEIKLLGKKIEEILELNELKRTREKLMQELQAESFLMPEKSPEPETSAGNKSDREDGELGESDEEVDMLYSDLVEDNTVKKNVEKRPQVKTQTVSKSGMASSLMKLNRILKDKAFNKEISSDRALSKVEDEELTNNKVMTSHEKLIRKMSDIISSEIVSGDKIREINDKDVSGVSTKMSIDLKVAKESNYPHSNVTKQLPSPPSDIIPSTKTDSPISCMELEKCSESANDESIAEKSILQDDILKALASETGSDVESFSDKRDDSGKEPISKSVKDLGSGLKFRRISLETYKEKHSINMKCDDFISENQKNYEDIVKNIFSAKELAKFEPILQKSQETTPARTSESSVDKSCTSVPLFSANTRNVIPGFENDKTDSLNKHCELFSKPLTNTTPLPPWATPVNRQMEVHPKKHVYSNILSPDHGDQTNDSDTFVFPATKRDPAGGPFNSLNRPQQTMPLNVGFSPRSGFETPDRNTLKTSWNSSQQNISNYSSHRETTFAFENNQHSYRREHNSYGYRNESQMWNDSRSMDSDIQNRNDPRNSNCWNNNFKRAMINEQEVNGASNYGSSTPRSENVNYYGGMSPAPSCIRDNPGSSTPRLDSWSNHMSSAPSCVRDNPGSSTPRIDPWSNHTSPAPSWVRDNTGSSTPRLEPWSNHMSPAPPSMRENAGNCTPRSDSWSKPDAWNCSDSWQSNGRRNERELSVNRFTSTQNNWSVDNRIPRNDFNYDRCGERNPMAGSQTPLRDYDNQWTSDSMSSGRESVMRRGHSFQRERSISRQTPSRDYDYQYSAREKSVGRVYQSIEDGHSDKPYQQGDSNAKSNFQHSNSIQQHTGNRFERARSVGKMYCNSNVDVRNEYSEQTDRCSFRDQKMPPFNEFGRSRSVGRSMFETKTGTRAKSVGPRSNYDNDSMFPAYNGNTTLKLEKKIDRFDFSVKRSKSLARESSIGRVVSRDVQAITKPMQKAIEMIEKSKQSQNHRDPRLNRDSKSQTRKDPRLSKQNEKLSNVETQNKNKEPKIFSKLDSDSNKKYKSRSDSKTHSKEKGDQSTKKHNETKSKSSKHSFSVDEHKDKMSKSSSKEVKSDYNKDRDSRQFIRSEHFNQREKISHFKIPKLKKVEIEKPAENNIAGQSVKSSESFVKTDDDSKVKDLKSESKIEPKAGNNETKATKITGDKNKYKGGTECKNKVSKEIKNHPMKHIGELKKTSKSITTISKIPEKRDVKKVKTKLKKTTDKTEKFGAVDSDSKNEFEWNSDFEVDLIPSMKSIKSRLFLDDSSSDENESLLTTFKFKAADYDKQFDALLSTEPVNDGRVELKSNFSTTTPQISTDAEDSEIEKLPTNKCSQKQDTYVMRNSQLSDDVSDNEAFLKVSKKANVDKKLEKNNIEMELESPIKSRLRSRVRRESNSTDSSVCDKIEKSPIPKIKKPRKIKQRSESTNSVSIDTNKNDDCDLSTTVETSVKEKYSELGTLASKSDSNCSKNMEVATNQTIIATEDIYQSNIIDSSNNDESTKFGEKDSCKQLHSTGSHQSTMEKEKEGNEADITNLVEILKNKEKMLKVLAMLSSDGEEISSKLKKKLEKLAEIESDEEDDISERSKNTNPPKSSEESEIKKDENAHTLSEQANDATNTNALTEVSKTTLPKENYPDKSSGCMNTPSIDELSNTSIKITNDVENSEKPVIGVSESNLKTSELVEVSVHDGGQVEDNSSIKLDVAKVVDHQENIDGAITSNEDSSCKTLGIVNVNESTPENDSSMISSSMLTASDKRNEKQGLEENTPDEENANSKTPRCVDVNDVKPENNSIAIKTNDADKINDSGVKEAKIYNDKNILDKAEPNPNGSILTSDIESGITLLCEESTSVDTTNDAVVAKENKDVSQNTFDKEVCRENAPENVADDIPSKNSPMTSEFLTKDTTEESVVNNISEDKGIDDKGVSLNTSKSVVNDSGTQSGCVIGSDGSDVTKQLIVDPENVSEEVVSKDDVTTKTKKKSKGSRELQMLHEYNYDMFMSRDILKATGVRSCTIAHLDNAGKSSANAVKAKTVEATKVKSTESKTKKSTAPKTKKTTPVPRGKATSDSGSPSLLPRVVVEKANISSLSSTKDIYEYSDDSSVVEDYQFVKQKPCPKSKKILLNKNTSDPLPESSVNATQPSWKKIKKKTVKKKRNSWQSGIIKKKKKGSTPTIKKDVNYCEKEYHFSEHVKEFKCKLCHYTGTNIVKHYKLKHPHSEVVISRLNSEQAKLACEEGVREIKCKSPKVKMYRCRFCMRLFRVKNLRIIFDHIVYTHTGEYKKECSLCSTKDKKKCVSVCNKSSTLPPADDFIDSVTGYMCALCNYTQLSHENLKTHIWLRHFNDECELKEINLTIQNARRRVLKDGLEVAKTEAVKMVKKKPRTVPSVTFMPRLRNEAQKVLRSKVATPKKKDTIPQKNSDDSGPLDKDNNDLDQSSDKENGGSDSVDMESDGEKQAAEGSAPAQSADNLTSTANNPTPITSNTSIFHSTSNLNEINIKQEIHEEQFLEDVDADLPDTRIKVEFSSPPIAEAEEADQCVVKLGLIQIKFIGDKLEYRCDIDSCGFVCTYLLFFKSHIDNHNADWDGFCCACNRNVTGSSTAPTKYNSALQHLLSNHSRRDREVAKPNVVVKQEITDEIMENSEQPLATSASDTNNLSDLSKPFIDDLYDSDSLERSIETLPGFTPKIQIRPLKDLTAPISHLSTADACINDKTFSTPPIDDFGLRNAFHDPDLLNVLHSTDVSNPELGLDTVFSNPNSANTSSSSDFCQLRIESVVSLKPNSAPLPDAGTSGNVQEVQKRDGKQKEAGMETSNTKVCISKVNVKTGTTTSKTVLPYAPIAKVMLFKCNECTFKTDEMEDFVLHYSAGSHPSGYKCVYCPIQCSNPTVIGQHILNEHGASRFNCVICDYRASVPILVATHALAFHKVKLLSVEEIQPHRSTRDGDLVKGVLPKSQCVTPYVCTYKQNSSACKQEFYSSSAFEGHIWKSHGPVRLECQLCWDKMFSCRSLVYHMKLVHNWKLLTCSYCAVTFDSKAEALGHLIIRHPGKRPLLYLRLNTISKDDARMNKDRVVLLNLDKGEFYRNTVKTSDTLNSTITHLLSKKELSLIFDAEKSAHSNITPSVQTIKNYKAASSDLLKTMLLDGKRDGRATSSSSVTTETSKDNPTINYQGDSDEANVILVDSDGDSGAPLSQDHVGDASTEKPSEVVPWRSQEEVGEKVTQHRVSTQLDKPFSSFSLPSLKVLMEATGITHDKLFRCGNASCKYSALNSCDFKDHLLICEHAKEFDMLSCFHCSKDFRNPIRLVDHIHSHGVHRYQCNECYYCSYRNGNVLQHMRKAHKATTFITVPLKPLHSDADVDYFVVKINCVKHRKPGPKTKTLQGGSPSRPTTPLEANPPPPSAVAKKSTFGPDEISLLPVNPILTQEIYCRECNFATKVRSNMLRHLQMHANEIAVPSVAPINPVPHLETNEMHFDKMANLALSSNINKPKEKSILKKKEKKEAVAEKVNHDYPKFVPEKQRYVCGSVGCKYISVDEMMLRLHWETLHTGEGHYYCVHCDKDVGEGSHYWSTGVIAAHLRLHEDTLYGCDKCSYTNPVSREAEKHSLQVHGKDHSFCIRKKVAPASKEPELNVDKAWQCNLCPTKLPSKETIAAHCKNLHDVAFQFKCSMCNLGLNYTKPFKAHFKRHPSGEPKILTMFNKVDQVNGSAIDNFPIWWKGRKRASIFSEDASVSQQPSPPKIPKPTVVDGPSNKDTTFKKNKYDPLKGVLPAFDLVQPQGDKYKCPFCFTFTSDSYYTMHQHLCEELKYRNWVCVTCGYKSFSSDSILEHSKSNHGTSQTKLLKGNPGLESWLEGLFRVQDEFIEKYKKDQSKDQSDLSDDLNLVIDEDVNTVETSPALKKANKCPHCDFQSVNGLNQHIKRHWKVKPFSCGYCNKGFVKKIEAKTHSKHAHPNVPFVCRTNEMPEIPEIVPLIRPVKRSCESGASTSTDDSTSSVAKQLKLQPDIKSHLCLKCEAHLSGSQMKEHTRDCEPDPRYPILPKKTIAVKCLVCMQLTKNISTLHQHFQQEHSGMEVNYVMHAVGKPKSKRTMPKPSPSEMPTNHNDTNTFMCAYCSSKFASYVLYLFHHKSLHSTQLMRFLPLTLCDLNKSEEIRVSAAGMECCVLGCNQSATNVKSLLSHVRSHYVVYKCHFCEAVFSVYKFYVGHTQAHAGMQSKEQEHFISNTVVQDRLMKIIGLYKSKMMIPLHSDEYSYIFTDESFGTDLSSPIGAGHKQTARKSTTSLGEYSKRLSTASSAENAPMEYSYYGSKPKSVDLKKTTINVEFFGVQRNLSVEQLSAIENLFPLVKVHDVYG